MAGCVQTQKGPFVLFCLFVLVFLFFLLLVEISPSPTFSAHQCFSCPHHVLVLSQKYFISTLFIICYFIGSYASTFFIIILNLMIYDCRMACIAHCYSLNIIEALILALMRLLYGIEVDFSWEVNF